jgi:indolepyruvate ferredoxin oxidoreductase alpha subunit
VKRLLTGTQALARGAVESGAHLVAACPGPVSGEVLTALRGSGVACRAVPSEKVALEVALGAALAGARALCVLRPGSLAGAAEALAAASASGASGLLVVACDDPSGRLGPPCDSRLPARDALLPILEPGDARECRDMVIDGLALSEQFETPVVLRLSARLADSADAVRLGTRPDETVRGQRLGPFAGPACGGARRAHALERLAQLAGHAWDTPLNQLELRGTEVGVVTSGMAHGMVREALPWASTLKLGLVHPLPTGLVRDFASRVRELVVVEELEPFIESELRAAGIACRGKDRVPRTGELTPALVARALGESRTRSRDPEVVAERPAELCPGCPHRATFQALKQVHVTVTGDLGCLALGGLPPLSAVARAPALGASVGVAFGLEAALGERARGRSVAVIGDGALLHSGLPALACAAAAGQGMVVVADNGSPRRSFPDLGGGRGDGEEVHAPGGWRVDLPSLCAALGAGSVRTVDPLDLEGTVATLREALLRPGSRVVLARSPCMRLREDRRPPQRVDERRCNRCGACLRLGCPALSDDGESMVISASACAGCGLCAQVCRSRAIGVEART